MTILQIGYPKSGNYWIYKIIQTILETAGIRQKNFIHQHPIYPVAREWELSYPEQVDVNMMDILYQGCFFRISSIFRKRIEDPEEYINNNTHVWTHSNYCLMSEQIFPMFEKIVYIIRDPRDVALSKAGFAFTPYMKKHYPTWYNSPSEYLKAEAGNIACEWRNHVKDYLRHADRHNVLLLFYERLKQNFEQELIFLLDYLGFSFTAGERTRILRKASANHMRKESPQHVQKARHYKWMNNMPPKITDQITSETKYLLEEMGYPVQSADKKLPSWKTRKSVINEN